MIGKKESRQFVPWPQSADGASGCAGREPAAFELLARYHTAVLFRDRFLVLQIVHDNSAVTFDGAFNLLGQTSQAWVVKLLKDGP